MDSSRSWWLERSLSRCCPPHQRSLSRTSRNPRSEARSSFRRAPSLVSTAFTGLDITVWMFAAAALLVLGVGLLFAARRRARSATHS